MEIQFLAVLRKRREMLFRNSEQRKILRARFFRLHYELRATPSGRTFTAAERRSGGTGSFQLPFKKLNENINLAARAELLLKRDDKYLSLSFAYLLRSYLFGNYRFDLFS